MRIALGGAGIVVSRVPARRRVDRRRPRVGSGGRRTGRRVSWRRCCSSWKRRDPMTFAGAAVVLVAVGILAAWLPAHRAAHLDPSDDCARVETASAMFSASPTAAGLEERNSWRRPEEQTTLHNEVFHVKIAAPWRALLGRQLGTCFPRGDAVTGNSLDARWRDPEQPEREDRDRLCRYQYGWERPLGSPARSTQRGRPCRRSYRGPPHGGVRVDAGDHHAYALRFSSDNWRRPGEVDNLMSLFQKCWNPSARTDRPWRALECNRTSGSHPGFSSAQNRPRRGVSERRNLLHLQLRWTIRPARALLAAAGRIAAGIPPPRGLNNSSMRRSTHRAVRATWIAHSHRRRAAIERLPCCGSRPTLSSTSPTSCGRTSPRPISLPPFRPLRVVIAVTAVAAARQ